jgi:ribonucleotide monophosphatase NagD (HAD superfamily)
MAGLGVSTYFYTKSKPAAQKPQLGKIMAAHKDLIIETQELTTLPKEAMIINVKNIEELTKTAEILGKPIMLTRRAT